MVSDSNIDRAAKKLRNEKGIPLNEARRQIRAQQNTSAAIGSSASAGVKWLFDSPKLTELVHTMLGENEQSHKTIQQAAAEVGFTLPPQNQDIGAPVALTDLKPGDVLALGNVDALYLGNSADGKQSEAVYIPAGPSDHTHPAQIVPLTQVLVGASPSHPVEAFRLNLNPPPPDADAPTEASQVNPAPRPPAAAETTNGPTEAQLAAARKAAAHRAQARLETLVCADHLKKQFTRLTDYLWVSRTRRQEALLTGRTVPKTQWNLVISGPPGSGKRTFAYAIADQYFAEGITTKPDLTVVTRADLVGTYEGSSAAKTREAVAKAAGGVLFILGIGDLVQGGHLRRDPFGREGLAALLAQMARDPDLVVILAGNKSDIDRISTEHSLAGSFKYRIDLPAVAPAALAAILRADLLNQFGATFASGAAVEEFFDERTHSLSANIGCSVEELINKLGGAGIAKSLADVTDMKRLLRQRDNAELSGEATLEDLEAAWREEIETPLATQIKR